MAFVPVHLMTNTEKMVKLKILIENKIKSSKKFKDYLDENEGMIPCKQADAWIHDLELDSHDICYNQETGKIDLY